MDASKANLSLYGSLYDQSEKLYDQAVKEFKADERKKSNPNESNVKQVEIEADHGFAFDRMCCCNAARNPEVSVRNQHGRCITNNDQSFDEMIYRQMTASENGKQDLGYKLCLSETEYLNRKNLMSTKGSFSSKVKAKLKALCDYAVSIPEKVVSYIPLFVRSTFQGLSDKLSTSDLNPFKPDFASQDLVAVIDASNATLNPKRANLLSQLHKDICTSRREDDSAYERIDSKPFVGEKLLLISVMMMRWVR